MDMFYRDFDSKAAVITGSKWLGALGARIAVTFVNALGHTDIKKRLQLTASQVWVLAVILAAWCGLSLFPATAGLADVVNGILFAIGAVALFNEVKEIGQAGAKAWMLAFDAKNDNDLEEAGKALAPALSGTVVTLLELLVTHAAFTAAEAAVLRRFPVPKWFEARFRKAAEPKGAEPRTEPQVAEGEPNNQSLPPERAQSQEPKEPNQSLPPEEPNQSRMPEKSKVQDPPERRPSTAERVARTVEGAVRLEGARKAAEVSNDSMAPVLFLGGLAAVGVTAALWALSSGRRRG